MKSNTLFFIEFLFFDVVALGWAAWEIWSVRPDKRGEGKEETSSTPGASPEPSGHPEG
jgi:hypothetical protein